MADDTRVRVKHIKALVDWIKKLVDSKVGSVQLDMSNITGVLSPEHGGTGCDSLDDLKNALGLTANEDPAIVTFHSDAGYGGAYPVQNYYTMTIASARNFTLLSDDTKNGTYQRVRVEKSGIYEIDMSPGMAVECNGGGAATSSSVRAVTLNLITSEQNQQVLDGADALTVGTAICECRAGKAKLIEQIKGTETVGNFTMDAQEGYQIVYLEAGTFLKVLPVDKNKQFYQSNALYTVTASVTVTARQIG